MFQKKVKSHSTILQRLRRQISLDYYTIPPATQAIFEMEDVTLVTLFDAGCVCFGALSRVGVGAWLRRYAMLKTLIRPSNKVSNVQAMFSKCS